MNPMLELHWYVEAPPPVRVADSPAQICCGAWAVMFGSGFTCTLTTALAGQFCAFVPITVYDVLLVGFTVMLAVVPPLFHENVPPPEEIAAVRTTCLPAHDIGGKALATTAGDCLTVISLLVV